jgi:prepilin-type processing-associated H-X9-DG protein
MATYTIIGGDGKEYGSVTADQLRRWIADGRANAQTRMRIEDATEWKSLAEFPEFQAALHVAAPPSLPPAAPVAASAAPAKMSGMAVTSLVLGILGIVTCGITVLLSAPIGLILGAVAMNKIGKSRGQLRGKGLALAGIITSGVTIILIPVFAAMMLPALAAAKQEAQQINCVNNEKQLALAIRIYSGDNKDKFPPAATWCDAIKTTAGSEKIFKCPAANSTGRCDYAFNAKLDGMDESKINPQTVLIFESDAGWNANGGPELLSAHARHGRGRVFVVAFADGHVESVAQSRLNTLRWNP